jgi:hypothetical protein
MELTKAQADENTRLVDEEGLSSTDAAALVTEAANPLDYPPGADGKPTVPVGNEPFSLPPPLLS